MRKNLALVGLPVAAVAALALTMVVHEQFVGDMMMIGAFLSIAVFVLRYLMTTWEASPEGRHMMAFSVVLFAALGVGVATLMVGRDHSAWPYVRVVVFAALWYVLVWRDVLLFGAQRRKAKADGREAEAGDTGEHRAGAVRRGAAGDPADR